MPFKGYRGCIGTYRLQGFPKSGGIFLGGPYHKHHSILGSILVCLFLGETTMWLPEVLDVSKMHLCCPEEKKSRGEVTEFPRHSSPQSELESKLLKTGYIGDYIGEYYRGD